MSTTLTTGWHSPFLTINPYKAPVHILDGGPIRPEHGGQELDVVLAVLVVHSTVLMHELLVVVWVQHTFEITTGITVRIRAGIKVRD